MVKEKTEKKEEKSLTEKDINEKLETLKKQILDKYGEMVKAIVIMGSVARGEFKSKSDVDLFVVLDDTQNEIPFDKKVKIDEELDKMAKALSPSISIQPSYTLTEFMDYARVAHPIIYNFIKEGKAIYDSGFFTPFKNLLLAGRIPATREAIESYMEGAPKKLMRAKTVKLLMLAEDCYYAILNTAQAVLMFLGLEPPVPSKAYDDVVKYLVRPGILDPKYAEWLREIIEVRKKIEHKELMDVTGEFVDEWIKKSEEFVDVMFKLLSVLEMQKKEKVLERTHEVMYKAAIASLKTLNKLPSDEKQIPEVFKRELIDTNLVEKYYWDIWQKIEVMKGLVDAKNPDKVDEKEVYKMREFVRNMIRDLSKVLKEKETKKK